VLPPAIIAGVVLIATWNLCDAVIAFRVAFFACPVCGLFILADHGAEGLALLVSVIVVALILSRVLRRGPIYYMSPPTPPATAAGGPYPPPPPPAPVPQLVRSPSGVYRAPSETLYRQLFEPPARPPRIADMRPGELWICGRDGWEMEQTDIDGVGQSMQLPRLRAASWAGSDEIEPWPRLESVSSRGSDGRGSQSYHRDLLTAESLAARPYVLWGSAVRV
jgi:hypothetical protein